MGPFDFVTSQITWYIHAFYYANIKIYSYFNRRYPWNQCLLEIKVDFANFQLLHFILRKTTIFFFIKLGNASGGNALQIIHETPHNLQEKYCHNVKMQFAHGVLFVLTFCVLENSSYIWTSDILNKSLMSLCFPIHSHILYSIALFRWQLCAKCFLFNPNKCSGLVELVSASFISSKTCTKSCNKSSLNNL